MGTPIYTTTTYRTFSPASHDFTTGVYNGLAGTTPSREWFDRFRHKYHTHFAIHQYDEYKARPNSELTGVRALADLED